MEEIRDIYYVRCSIPSDALDYKPRFLLFSNAADIGIVIGVYEFYERPGNTWSCDLLCSTWINMAEGKTVDVRLT